MMRAGGAGAWRPAATVAVSTARRHLSPPPPPCPCSTAEARKSAGRKLLHGSGRWYLCANVKSSHYLDCCHRKWCVSARAAVCCRRRAPTEHLRLLHVLPG